MNGKEQHAFVLKNEQPRGATWSFFLAVGRLSRIFIKYCLVRFKSVNFSLSNFDPVQSFDDIRIYNG